MTPTFDTPRHVRHLLHATATGACALVLLMAMPSANALSRAIPTTDRDGAATIDPFVSRNQPEGRDNKEFKFGQLGILLPSYNKESLYLAYRALLLEQNKLEKQAQETAPKVFVNDEPKGGVDVWTKERSAVTDKPLPRPIEQDRSFEAPGYGQYLNCPNGAFNLAAETLQSLKTNSKIGKAAVQEWVAAQDQVFDLCSDPRDAASAPVMPQPLPASAPVYLRQLRQYQIAAAHFYAGKFDEALSRFDAIASDKTHPLRAWASHASLRTLLRNGSLDNSVAKVIAQLKTSTEPEASKLDAYSQVQARSERKLAQIHAQITTRANAILADKSLAKLHDPVRKLLKQAGLYLVPEQVYAQMSANLDHFDKDFERNGQLDEWSAVGERLFDYGGGNALLAKLRAQFEYFDWIRTVQGCTDNRLSPNYRGHCADEAAHALTMWQITGAKPWLVATLMTAQQITPPVEAAFAAAKQTAPDGKEYLTVRYYMARLLRTAGRADEALALLQPVLPGTPGKVPPALLRHADSANHLFRQEMLALAKNESQALPYLAADTSRIPAADADALLNRRLASEDLLRLANNPAVANNLAPQMLIAAWWRSDIAGKSATAEKAAQQLVARVPEMRDAASAYLKLNDAQERHFLLAKTAITARISPQIYHGGKDAKRKPAVANWWCSFDDKDFSEQASIQRSPAITLDLAQDGGKRDQELQQLKQAGTAADWLARIALQRAKTTPADPDVRAMLDAVLRSEELECISPDSETLLAAAKQTLASLPGQGAAKAGARAPSPISEAEVRARYEAVKKTQGGKLEYRVSHIMVATEAEALAAQAKIQSGASFEELAKQISKDPSSASKGGDLGWAAAEVFIPPFADAVRTLTIPGRYAKPVRTQFGWHLIETHGIRPAQFPSFEQARPIIEQEMRKQQGK